MKVYNKNRVTYCVITAYCYYEKWQFTNGQNEVQ